MNATPPRSNSLSSFATALLLALTASATQATDYSWSGSGNWSAGNNWTTLPTDDATVPNSTSDNVVGNSSTGSTSLNQAAGFVVNDFTATTSGWTVFANLAGTNSSLTVGGLLKVNEGVTLTMRNGAAQMSLTAGQVQVNGLLSLGTAGVQLQSFSVTGGTTLNGGGVLSANLASDYSLGLLSTNGSASSVLNLTNSNGAGQSRTVSVSGLSSSGSGVTTIRTTTVASTGAHLVTLLIDNTADYSSNALLENGSGNAGNRLGIVKAGSGVQTLTNVSSSYTGATVINGGVLGVASLANGGSNSSIGAASSDAGNLVLDGGTLRHTGGAASTDRLFSVGTSGGTLEAAGTGNLNFSNTGAMGFNGEAGARSLTLAGSAATINTLWTSIGDSGGATSITKTGSTTWALFGDNSFTGGTRIEGGVLRVNNDHSLGDRTSRVTIDGGTLQATANVRAEQEVQLGNVGGVISVNSGVKLTLAGNVRDVEEESGSLTKTTAGTLILTGSNSYRGGTVVSAGTLLVNNTAGSGVGSGDVTVAASAILGGSGNIELEAGRSVSISGVLSVGSGSQNGAENFVIHTSGLGALRMEDHSNLLLDLWTNALDGADRLVVNGAVEIGSNVTLTLTNAGAISFSMGDRFDLFDWEINPIGAFDEFILPTLEAGLIWDTSELYTTGVIQVIPEPSVLVWLLPGLASLPLFRRSKHGHSAVRRHGMA